MPLSLPALPYGFSDLEPHIDTRTMEIHHGKHHAAYVNNANKALESAPALASLSPEDILRKLEQAPDSVRTALRNNVGGHVNHSLFWQIMGKPGAGGGGTPGGEVGRAITATFGDFGSFKEKFAAAAAGRFGSGWAWLVVNKSKQLEITSSPNQDSPIMDGLTPVLGLDVWEHAYYLHYQNRRPDYVTSWWNVVHWSHVDEFFRQATK